MGLKPCKTCGKSISTSATKCPNCGERNPTATPFSQKSTTGKVAEAGFMGISSIFVIICAIVIFIVILMLI